jgi:hypothetical protein
MSDDEACNSVEALQMATKQMAKSLLNLVCPSTRLHFFEFPELADPEFEYLLQRATKFTSKME